MKEHYINLISFQSYGKSGIHMKTSARRNVSNRRNSLSFFFSNLSVWHLKSNKHHNKIQVVLQIIFIFVDSTQGNLHLITSNSVQDTFFL